MFVPAGIYSEKLTVAFSIDIWEASCVHAEVSFRGERDWVALATTNAAKKMKGRIFTVEGKRVIERQRRRLK
jgi:hypothetical protein